MDDLEVRELRYFVAVAEELNFTRAAERLGMAQPPLSRVIRQIEARLGVQLLERSTRHVSLTIAGTTLLDEAKDVLDAVSAASRRTRRAGTTAPRLVITAKSGVATGLLQRIVDAYHSRSTAAHAEIEVSGWGEQAGMVHDGRADLALLSSPYDASGLDAESLTTEPRVLALPVDHRLARRRELRCQDLAGESMPRWADSTAAERAYWSGRAAGGPTEPHGPVVTDGAQLLEVVGLGQAVALVPRSMAELNPRVDVAYRAVSDASPYAVAVAWPPGARSRAISEFVRVAIEYSARLNAGAYAVAVD
ncbi:MAG: LysR family transcriptional regulator [Pseudonocardiaceae bacterium]|nr:LysR family transcriptional regulator [Pseudonocardiaceae bacterium]